MLATVALGYADGILRALSNKGAAVAGGQRAPSSGRVSMDLITLDVTRSWRRLTVGDEVEFLGDTCSLEEVAAAGRHQRL